MRPDEELTSEQFDNVSIIIATYLYQLTNFCSSTYHLDWSTVTYSYFVEKLKAIPGTSNSMTNLFSISQLEQLMRTLSESYIPGDQQVLKTPATRSGDVSMECTFGNLKVQKSVRYRRK
jgi:Zinc transporter ZIP4 domain